MEERFRDSIGTITEDGKRAWVYPKKPSGSYFTYRKYVSYTLLTFLFLAPFVKVGGNQFMLFNVLERRFNIFGLAFWPQDFYLMAISLIIAIVLLALFTVAFGRIFCGWICPQTIFMEMVFRRIEYWIDGDRGAQMRLDRSPWTGEKIRKRLLKWTIFFFISFLIANIFLAYLIGSDTLISHISDGPTAHTGTMVPLLIFTGVFYFIFAWFREQVCIIACPYGRLQGVLLDDKSIVVAYDHKRGEGENGRKKFRKNEDRDILGHGDCIDCFQCVHVCPTGIDIRNGTQLECVNCTACIDECDHIMDSIGKPRGLIRYASEEEITKKAKFKFTPRMKGYTAILFILVGILTGLLFLRGDLETNILRLPGQLYQRKENNMISNVYTYKLLNKTSEDIEEVSFKLMSHHGEIKMVSRSSFGVPSQKQLGGTFFVEINASALQGSDTQLKIGIFSGTELLETTSVQFMGPRSYK